LGEDESLVDVTASTSYIGERDKFDLANSQLPTARRNLATAHGEKTGKRVAIIGAGPSGLSCAHDLALLGHEVHILEASAVAGGMLRLGVPEYRLPRELLDLEIESILRLGPTIQFEQALGRDYSLADLRQDFEAVFIAIGSYQSRGLNVEGEDLDSVLRAVDFLINVNLGGYSLDLGERVLVVGGGNVAMDVARTAARLGDPVEAGGDLGVALDVARTAVRLGTTKQVHCLVVEDRHEMLADAFEIEEAELEGVVIHNQVLPKRIVGENGRAVGLETLEVARTFDDQGRFNPELIPDTERFWPCDSVVIAIGQTGELEWVQPEDGLEVTSRGTLVMDRKTLATTAPGVFAGGDIAFGPRLIVNAVADGQLAARSIHSHLQNVETRIIRKGHFIPVPKRNYADQGPLRGYLRWERRSPASLSVDRRIGVTSVEVGYDEQAAKEQAGRCLICTINPVFDGDLCILCNGCVDVCPTDCLKLVPVEALSAESSVTAWIDQTTSSWASASAMLFDPTRCIRCGLCAARCPTDAVKMESFHFSEELEFAPQEATK
jgi:NADPH-dependent glutamate synthase beta subunit-like oxidoreductase